MVICKLINISKFNLNARLNTTEMRLIFKDVKKLKHILLIQILDDVAFSFFLPIITDIITNILRFLLYIFLYLA